MWKNVGLIGFLLILFIVVLLIILGHLGFSFHVG